MWLFFCYTIQLITIKLCTKFQNPNLNSFWEIFDRKNVYMYYMYIRVKERKNEKEGKMRISILISIYTEHFAFLKVYTKYENAGSNRSWEICDRNFQLERKKNEQIKGLISNMWLFFCYTIQLITIKLCTKFQNPNSNFCWEIFDRKNVHMYYIREKDGKNKNLKKVGKIRLSILISIYTVQFAILKMFFCYTIQLITIKLCIKFQNPNPSSCWEIFDGKKSLQTDKPTDRQT